MAINNKLSKPGSRSMQTTSYEANGKQVTLSPEIVKSYLVSGDKDRVSMTEIVMFINLCKFSGLNPWLKEAYCIKYGTEPATMVVGKEAFLKRAEQHPEYDGQKSGIIILKESGDIEYRNGAFFLPGEEIVGGWAEVFRKDWSNSIRVEVSFDEYAGKKKDGTLNSQWSKKPATMIRKVAQVQALKEAFTTNLGAMYTAEEQGVEEPNYMLISEPEAQQEQVEDSDQTLPSVDPQTALFGD